MQMNCPVCHAQFPLEAALQHDAGREVMAMLSGMAPELSRGVLHYLGYFRPAKQQLGWGRALKLMREVLDLAPAQTTALVDALTEAARGLDEKRHQPGWKPLGNHNYLLRCLESVVARTARPSAPQAVALACTSPAPRSRAGQALANMEALKQ